jgi:hypothetical protein
LIRVWCDERMRWVRWVVEGPWVPMSTFRRRVRRHWKQGETHSCSEVCEQKAR